jgi:hypothetical protein
MACNRALSRQNGAAAAWPECRRVDGEIAAKVDKVDEVCFREKIAPLLSDPGVEFIGEINEHSKTEFLGEAQALARMDNGGYLSP